MYQKAIHDASSRPRTFAVGESVHARNFGPGGKWGTGQIVEAVGRVSFLVQLDDGRLWKRHQDQLRYRYEKSREAESTMLESPPGGEGDEMGETELHNSSQTEDGSKDTGQERREPTGGRYPTRVHRPPERFQQNPDTV